MTFSPLSPDSPPAGPPAAGVDPPPDPPPSGTRLADPLPALLDAWAALCLAAGRRSLPAASACDDAPAGAREAVALALVALGYPEALASAHALAAVLRRYRDRPASDGRTLRRSMSRGGGRWYVAPAQARGVAA